MFYFIKPMSQSNRVQKEFGSVKTNVITSRSTPIQNITTSYTLGSVDSGKQLFIKGTAASTLTLPAVGVSAGQRFDLVLATAAGNSVASCVITKNAADSANIVGGMGLVYTSNTAKSSITFGTAGSIGDSLKLVSNGTNWFATGVSQSGSGAFA